MTLIGLLIEIAFWIDLVMVLHKKDTIWILQLRMNLAIHILKLIVMVFQRRCRGINLTHYKNNNFCHQRKVINVRIFRCIVVNWNSAIRTANFSELMIASLWKTKKNQTEVSTVFWRFECGLIKKKSYAQFYYLNTILYKFSWIAKHNHT